MRLFNFLSLNIGKIALFLILPIVFLYIGLFVSSEIGAYHLFTCDSEYAFLLNGLNLLNFSLPYVVTGPATPLQVYCAVIISIIHLFRLGTPLNIDVLQNPEVYLHGINFSIILLTSIVLFFTGYCVYKSFNKNIFSGLFIQLAVFSSWLMYDFMRRIMVENLIIIGVLILIILIFKYIHYMPVKEKVIDKYVVWFSITIGFIAATKLMYLPIAIIPFLLLDGYKKKSAYVLLSIFSFCVFGFAIFNRWNAFFYWYWDNFVHSGQYGVGNKTIIDINTFKNNFTYIFFSDSVFFKLFLLNTVSVIIYHLPVLKVKQKNDKLYKAMLGIYLTTIIMILLVAKQFKYYYMITVLLLQIPALLLAIHIFSRNLLKKWKYIIFSPIVIFVFILVVNESSRSFKEHNSLINKRNKYLEAVNFMNKNIKDTPVLILPTYYGTSFKEYGIYFGLGWLGGTKVSNKYAAILKQIYPVTYFYSDWNKKFYRWGELYNFTDLLKKHRQLILYSNEPNLEHVLNDRLHGINRQLDTKYSLIKATNNPYEKYFMVEYDSSKSISNTPLIFDLEQYDSINNNFINSQGILIGDAVTRSREYAFSGKISAKANSQFEYTLTCALSELKSGECYRISVWRYNNPDAGLVIEGPKDKYYHFFSVPSDSLKGWDKIEVNFIVPEILNDESIKIYCWNSDKNNPAYFDDLFIERIK